MDRPGAAIAAKDMMKIAFIIAGEVGLGLLTSGDGMERLRLHWN